MNQTPPTSQPKIEEIRELAYYLWRQANGTLGQDLDFWLQAERQLLMRAPAPEVSSVVPRETSTEPEQTDAGPPETTRTDVGRSPAKTTAEPASDRRAKRQPRRPTESVQARRAS